MSYMPIRLSAITFGVYHSPGYSKSALRNQFSPDLLGVRFVMRNTESEG